MYDHHEVKRQVFLIESKTIGLWIGIIGMQTYCPIHQVN